ncbi:MAG: hypothetical protein ACJ74Q_17675 [Pyrinomonadaceae bacterium]
MERRAQSRLEAARRISVLLAGTAILFVACNRVEPAADSSTTGTSGRTQVQAAENRQAGAAQTVNASTSQPPVTKVSETEPTKPSIEITLVPPRGAGEERMERIAGSVSGVDAGKSKVVIFAHTDVWYVQPYTADPDTQIGEGGHWENDTHLGRDYAALLVKSAYKPPGTTGKLPPVAGDVLAIAQVQAK